MSLQPVENAREPPRAVLRVCQGNLEPRVTIDNVTLAARVETNNRKPVCHGLQHNMGSSFNDAGQQEYVHLAHHVQYLPMGNSAIPQAGILDTEGPGPGPKRAHVSRSDEMEADPGIPSFSDRLKRQLGKFGIQRQPSYPEDIEPLLIDGGMRGKRIVASRLVDPDRIHPQIAFQEALRIGRRRDDGIGTVDGAVETPRMFHLETGYRIL